MKLTRTAAATLGAVALALSPTAALAHGDKVTFENCTDAYEHGHAHIPESSEHYEDKLDRDQDGVGCDNPPSGFEPLPAEDDNDDGQEPTPQESTPSQDSPEPDLAETGGDDMTPYYAGAGALVLLAGTGVLVASRKRRTDG